MKNFTLLTLSLSLTLSAMAAQPATSRQVILETSLKETSCILIDADSLHENPEIDFFNSECPGIGGYRVLFKGGDLRSYITLNKDGNMSTLRLPMTDTDFVSFPYVSSENIQWAFNVINNEKIQALGLMFDMSGQDESADTHKDVKYSVIAKFTGKSACVVAKLKQENEESKVLALETLKKASSLKCLN